LLPDGSVGDNNWVLEEISPDGQQLTVSTEFGGEASDCTRFEGWEVEESDDSGEIRARLWERRSPTDCTTELVVERFEVGLDESLGDRELVGCGAEDCLAIVADR